jgi:hypothetical protein
MREKQGFLSFPFHRGLSLLAAFLLWGLSLVAASSFSSATSGSPSRIRDQYRSPKMCPVLPVARLYLCATRRSARGYWFGK